MPLAFRASALLAEMARDHGLARLEFDADGLIVIDLEDFVVGIILCKPRDSFFFIAWLDGAGGDFPGIGQLADSDRPPQRTAQVCETATGARLLVAELPGNALPYPDFARALEEFVVDVERARAATREQPLEKTETLPSDEMHWIRS